jgi:hypothetical protein
MGPIEITFLVLLVVFGAIGLVRGYPRELGVTTMLLIALFVLVFMQTYASQYLQKFLEFVAGADPAKQKNVQAFMFCGFLIVIAFISYQGETLTFPDKGPNSFISLGTGVLNGYLFAGSLWYYLACANWPLLDVQPPYTKVYYALSTILPPAIFKWQYLIALVVLMLILRVWK